MSRYVVREFAKYKLLVAVHSLFSIRIQKLYRVFHVPESNFGNVAVGAASNLDQLMNSAKGEN